VPTPIPKKSVDVTIRDFTIDVDEATILDLRDRLHRTRWPQPEPVSNWSQGIPLKHVRDLCRYWADDYDWSARQTKLNSYPQVRVDLDGLAIHCVHLRSPHENATPLILTHGWPGSFVEYLGLAYDLTRPASARAADAFHVVIPSLPGYGFSSQPLEPGWGVSRIARLWADLMSELGYARFGAVGSDWGTSISSSLGAQFPDRVIALALIPPLAAPDPATYSTLTAAESKALSDLERVIAEDSAYSAMHTTRPQTTGYALVDSPAALCAWLTEKFWQWTDHDGDLYSVIDRDRVLDNLMIYWVTQTGASSVRLYWESFSEIHAIFSDAVVDTIDVPVGALIFPREVPRISKRWAERRFSNILQWREHSRGGHFAAMEQPHRVVGDIRDLFARVPRE
jgi:pimeloyl-ACP methyl ester carboxylesterase